jgi:phospholipid/cholesterol/gamma-HCH transport system substrate-binding protein
MRFRIKYADKIVGLFVVVAAVFLAGGIIVLGANQRWFAKDIRFQTRFSSAAGASPGTAIMMRGFQVGKVAKVKLNDANQVDAEFVIYDSYYPKVKEYSILELVTSPIGLGTQLLFHPGKGESPAAPGSFIPLADSDEGRDLIDRGLVDIPVKDDSITRLMAGINPLVENVNKTVVTVNRTLTEVNRALAGQSSGPLGSIVNDASSTVSNIDALSKNLTTQTKTLLDSVNAISKNLEATTEAIRDPTGLVPKLLDPKGSLKTLLDDKNELYNSINGSVVELQKTLKNIQEITSSLSDEMPSIAVTIDEGRTAIKQAQDVMIGLKNNPLLRGGIPARVERQPQSQSMREGQF